MVQKMAITSPISVFQGLKRHRKLFQVQFIISIYHLRPIKPTVGVHEYVRFRLFISMDIQWTNIFAFLLSTIRKHKQPLKSQSCFRFPHREILRGGGGRKRGREEGRGVGGKEEGGGRKGSDEKGLNYR